MPAHEIVERSEDGFTVVCLRSRDARAEAEFVPQLSMLGRSLRLGDAEFLHHAGSLADYAATRRLQGIPLLHPWANRLEGDTYTAGGPSVHLDRRDATLTRDRNGLPIHGLLLGAIEWEVLAQAADDDGASLQARFRLTPESGFAPNFPFPHEIRIDVHLREARLEIGTTVRASGDVAVPIAFGFHPYFRLPAEARSEWRVALPVRSRLVLDERMIPTGREEAWAFPIAPLGKRTFDDGFAGIADGDRFLLHGKCHRLTVELQEGYPFAQVYAPPDRDFICFEPMTAPANALVSGNHLRRVQPGEEFHARWAVQLERV